MSRIKLFGMEQGVNGVICPRETVPEQDMMTYKGERDRGRTKYDVVVIGYM